MYTIERARSALRISHTLLDCDIENNIDAARFDMRQVGINIDKDDVLLDKAVELYCKAQFDYLGKGEQFQQNYEKLRDAISLAGDYRCGMK